MTITVHHYAIRDGISVCEYCGAVENKELKHPQMCPGKPPSIAVRTDDTHASVVRYLRAMAVHLRTKALARGLVSQLDAQYLAQQAEGYECAALDLEQKLDLDPERLRELGIEP